MRTASVESGGRTEDSDERAAATDADSSVSTGSSLRIRREQGTGVTGPMSTAPQYLLAIYIAQHRDGPPVSPGTLGEMVDRSPAAVTEMCQRLAERGLVSYEPYDGVTLTSRDARRPRSYTRRT